MIPQHITISVVWIDLQSSLKVICTIDYFVSLAKLENQLRVPKSFRHIHTLTVMPIKSKICVPNSGNILENLLDDDNEIVKVINEQDCLTPTPG